MAVREPEVPLGSRVHLQRAGIREAAAAGAAINSRCWPLSAGRLEVVRSVHFPGRRALKLITHASFPS